MQHLIAAGFAFRNDKEKEPSLAGKMAPVELLALVEGRAGTDCATRLRRAQIRFRITIPVETGLSQLLLHVPILKTPAPRIFPSWSRIKASFASSNLNSWVSGTIGISAAKGRNS
jgi:hypothetical protein